MLYIGISVRRPCVHLCLCFLVLHLCVKNKYSLDHWYRRKECWAAWEGRWSYTAAHEAAGRYVQTGMHAGARALIGYGCWQEVCGLWMPNDRRDPRHLKLLGRSVSRPAVIGVNRVVHAWRRVPHSLEWGTLMQVAPRSLSFCPSNFQRVKTSPLQFGVGDANASCPPRSLSFFLRISNAWRRVPTIWSVRR